MPTTRKAGGSGVTLWMFTFIVGTRCQDQSSKPRSPNLLRRRRSVQDSGAAGEVSVAQARGTVRSDQHGRRRGGDELHTKIINIKERKEKSREFFKIQQI